MDNPHEEPPFHDAALPGVHLGKLVETVIECTQVQSFGLRQRSRFIKSQPPTCVTFCGTATAGNIHENFPHELRCKGEEMPSALDSQRTGLHQSQVGLMDQPCTL
jgi:hypothetical protein